MATPARTNRRTRPRARSLLGTSGLILGSVLLCLGFVADSGGELPFPMPRTWYINRPLWCFFAVACIVLGGYLLKSRGRPARWQPTRPGLRFRRVVLYSRKNCDLCRQAGGILREYTDYLPEPQEVDVDENPKWLQKFGTCVPVVEIDGKVRFRGRLNETLLQRLIEGTPPLDAGSDKTAISSGES